MDKQIYACQNLTKEHIDFLHKIEQGMPLTADLTRSDILLCCRMGENQALVARHMMPQSTISLYRGDATGRTLGPDEQPLILRTLKTGNGGRGQKEILDSGAPVIQDCFPIFDDRKQVIAAVVFEINMVAYERHRRRNRSFRQAVSWLQEMCLRGELVETATLSRFGMYDGVYLVDRARRIIYMNGIAANMYRSIGVSADMREQNITGMEPLDNEMVEMAFHLERPTERRHESSDGRIWIRKVIPLQMAPVTWQNYWQNWGWTNPFVRNGGTDRQTDAVLVTVHNATDAVQKQRELNVKSAIIQEVHHRVKNNLQTIAAILRIQARRTDNEESKQHLTDAVNRILSMSVIHEFLSQDEHRPINVRDVCQRIATQIAQVVTGPDQRVTIKVDGPNVRLPASQATPTALVINELLLNAVEHGVHERKVGAIWVHLVDLGDSVRIIVEDDGLGLPADFDQSHSNSLGLQIVHTLVTDDLKGEFRMESIGHDDTCQAADCQRDGSQAGECPPGEGETVAPPPAAPADERLTGTEMDGDLAVPTGARAIVTFPKRSLKAD